MLLDGHQITVPIGADGLVARAGFDKSAKMRSDQIVQLRYRTRVINGHLPD